MFKSVAMKFLFSFEHVIVVENYYRLQFWNPHTAQCSSINVKSNLWVLWWNALGKISIICLVWLVGWDLWWIVRLFVEAGSRLQVFVLSLAYSAAFRAFELSFGRKRESSTHLSFQGPRIWKPFQSRGPPHRIPSKSTPNSQHSRQSS